MRGVLYVCYMYVYTHMSISVSWPLPAYLEARSWIWMSPLYVSPPHYLRQSLSLNLESLVSDELRDPKTQGASASIYPALGLQLCTNCLALCESAGDQNWVLHKYLASILPTERSSKPKANSYSYNFKIKI